MADEAISKPTLVRIKRKRSDESVDVLWLLEQSSSKRQDIDVGKLSLDDQSNGPEKILFRRLQTVPVSQVKQTSFAHSLMSELSSKSTAAEKKSERRSSFKKVKKLEPTAREEHEKVARAARYKQVWRNRLGSDNEDAMQDIFQLYDVDRVDDEEEKRSNELLEKFMPLLQHYSPEKFGKDEGASTSTAPAAPADDEYVYDVYAVDEEMDEEESAEDWLTLQVSEHLVYGRQEDEVDSDYDSEDSNREDNPNCDYPDDEEEDEEDSAYDEDTEDESDKDDDSADEDEEWRNHSR